MPERPYRCGHIAIMGRPNVGKSTLLNAMLGQKLSITSRKPQTTRHPILGIRTTPEHQAIFIDTPGIHSGRGRALNRYMNRVAEAVMPDVDLVLFVIEALQWTDADRHVAGRLRGIRSPVLLAMNKIDRIPDKSRLLPFMEKVRGEGEFAEIVPVSARRGRSVVALASVLGAYLPEGPPLFEADQLTDRSERFVAAELIREKLTRRLGQELPYSVSVEIERYEETGTDVQIDAVVWVERQSQKGIVVGKRGQGLKHVGTEARQDLEVMLERKVFLRLWAKVREGWTDDELAIRRFGYVE